MNLKTHPSVIAAAASIVTLLAGAALAAERAQTIPYSTPPGITLVEVTDATDKYLWTRFGDATGKPLYFYGNEAPGKPACNDDCTKEFPPLVAPSGAAIAADWSIVTRVDNLRQWVYQGHPLYTYAGKDPGGEITSGRGRRGGGMDELSNPASSANSPKKGWVRASFAPENSVLTPSGILLKSLPVANGYGFVAEGNGMPIYILKTPPKNAAAWTPCYAPAIARPKGDFTIAAREDGTTQWAYKGQLLYTFNGDYSPTDLNGLAVEKGAQPAIALRHFMPAAVDIQILPLRGPVMTTVKGLSLYTQSRYKLQYGGRHARDGYRTSYAVGKAVGTRGCVDACTEEWRPLAAPANAQASGFWELAARADGSKQWVFKGDALYTFVGDRKAGDIQGNNRHEVLYGDAEGKIDLSVTDGDNVEAARDVAGSGLYWHVVTFVD